MGNEASEAINSVFPDTEVQLCIIHQIRNSLKYVGSAYQKQFAKELKKVYQALSLPQRDDTVSLQMTVIDTWYPHFEIQVIV